MDRIRRRYGAVDENALREVDQPRLAAAGAGGDGDDEDEADDTKLAPEVLGPFKAQLAAVRGAARGEGGAGAAVELD